MCEKLQNLAEDGDIHMSHCDITGGRRASASVWANEMGMLNNVGKITQLPFCFIGPHCVP